MMTNDIYPHQASITGRGVEHTVCPDTFIFVCVCVCSTCRYRPKGVLGKGVGNHKNASEMRQKCVKIALKLRPKCFKNASKMRQNRSGFIGTRGTFLKNARNTFKENTFGRNRAEGDGPKWQTGPKTQILAETRRHPKNLTRFGLTPEYCGKTPPEQWELWEGKPLKPYHFNRTLGAQKASSKYCQTSTSKQRELWEQNRL